MRGQFSGCCATAAPSATGEMLIRSMFSGAELAVPPEIAALLDQCRPFRTIEDHVAFIARDRPGNASALRALHSCLESFIRAGFLVSSTDLLDWAAKRAESSSPCRLETITIPSCNRGESLIACLRSFDRHHRRLGRVATFVVADDARDDAGAATTLAALQALSARSISIRYSNRAMRRRFADLLAQRACVRRELPEFALCGLDEVPAHGSACTALILDTVGEAFVQVDDDVLCRTARAPGARSGIEVASRGDATQKWFFDSQDQTLARISEVPEDLLGAHEALLGRSVVDCLASSLADSTTPCDPAPSWDLDAEILGDLALGRGRIGITPGAYYGDAATQDNGCFFLSGGSRRRLLACERSFRAAVESRQVFVGARRTAVSPTGFCMGLHFGVDNRSLVPPFLSLPRGSDSIFALTLRICFPGVYAAHVPLAIHHEPPRPRRQTLEGVRQAAGQLGSTSIVRLVLDHFAEDVPRSEAAVALRHLGGRLRAVAASETEFCGAVNETAIESARWTVEALDRQIDDRSETPEFFRAHLAELRERIRLNSRRPDYATPHDVARVLGATSALSFLRRQVGLYGELLENWPGIVQAARELRGDGMRLSKNVAPS